MLRHNLNASRSANVFVCVNREQIFAHFSRYVVVTRFVRINSLHLVAYIYCSKWGGHYYIIGNQCVQMKCRTFVDFIRFCVDMNNNKIAGSGETLARSGVLRLFSILIIPSEMLSQIAIINTNNNSRWRLLLLYVMRGCDNRWRMKWKCCL